MSSPFSILCAISVRENLPERSNTYIAEYLYFPLLHNKSKTLLSFDIYIFQPFNALSMHWRQRQTSWNVRGCGTHTENRQDQEILTGCIRVNETANHDGEVEFLLLELKWWCRFSLTTRHKSIELRQLSDFSFYTRWWRIQLLRAWHLVCSAIILQNNLSER